MPTKYIARKSRHLKVRAQKTKRSSRHTIKNGGGLGKLLAKLRGRTKSHNLETPINKPVMTREGYQKTLHEIRNKIEGETLQHYWYKIWSSVKWSEGTSTNTPSPIEGVPLDDDENLLKLAKMVLKRKKDYNKSVIVHSLDNDDSKAHTFILVLIALEEIKTGESIRDKHYLKTKLNEIIKNTFSRIKNIQFSAEQLNLVLRLLFLNFNTMNEYEYNTHYANSIKVKYINSGKLNKTINNGTTITDSIYVIENPKSEDEIKKFKEMCKNNNVGQIVVLSDTKADDNQLLYIDDIEPIQTINNFEIRELVF